MWGGDAVGEPGLSGAGLLENGGVPAPSIPDGVAAVQWLGRENGFAVEATESVALFTDEDLRRYDAVVFFNTTGDVLDAEQQAAFERYVRAGGGYAGVHAAADTEYDWE